MRYLTRPQLAMIVLAVAYLVSPVDFLPEILTGPVGLTDDAAAFTVLISMLLAARSKARGNPAIAVPAVNQASPAR
jgi:uncharacterized membrane protein YkvA (DUF1232 family)